MTYEEQLQHPRWKERREEILHRDWYMCQVCMSSKNLHVHHKRYIEGRKAWEYEDKDLVTLCGKHHQEEHSKYTPIPDRDPYIESWNKLARAVRGLNGINHNILWKETENG